MSYLLKTNFVKLIFVFAICAALFPIFALQNSTNAQTRKYGTPGQNDQCPVNGLNRIIPNRSPGASQGESRYNFSADVACTCAVSQCRLSTARNFMNTGNQNVEGLTSDLQFTCIDGSVNPSDYLTRDGKYGDEYDVALYRDTEYWKEVANALSSDLSYAQQFCPSGTTASSTTGAGNVRCCVNNLDALRVACGAGSTNIFAYACGFFGTVDDISQSLGVGACRDIPIDTSTLVDQGGIYYMDIFSSDSSQQVIPAGSTCKISPNDPNGVAYWQYAGYFDVLEGKVPGEGSGTNTLVGGQCGALYRNGNVLFADTDLFGTQVGGTQTLFGCLPNSINGLTAFLVRLVVGLSILVTFAIVIINLIQIVANSTNGEAIAEYQKKMFAGIYTLIGILLSVTLLSIFGLQIIGFGSDGIGGALFRFFVGG